MSTKKNKKNAYRKAAKMLGLRKFKAIFCRHEGKKNPKVAALGIAPFSTSPNKNGGCAQ